MAPERVKATDDDAVVRAAHAMDHQGLAVVPTDTLYGLAADALTEEAVERVYAAKARPRDQPLPVAVADVEGMRHVARVTPLARRLAAVHLPGALTLVLDARGTVPDALIAGGDTVAVRVPGNDYALRLAAHFGPITITSANLHGEPAPGACWEAERQLGDAVELYVDGGGLPGTPSTIVDARGETPRVLRVGAVELGGGDVAAVDAEE